MNQETNIERHELDLTVVKSHGFFPQRGGEDVQRWEHLPDKVPHTRMLEITDMTSQFFKKLFYKRTKNVLDMI